MSKVKRSVYQKVCEENKKLIKEIRILVEDGIAPVDQLICSMKWRKQFREERKLHEMLRIAGKKYIKEHAAELPDFLTKDLTTEL